jgi:hypothetical protein
MMMRILARLRKEVMEKLAARIVAVVVGVLGSGLAGFHLARSDDKATMQAEIKAEVLHSIQPSLDSAASKTAQILFQLDQVLTPDQKLRAAANFNQAKANLGIK